MYFFIQFIGVEITIEIATLCQVPHACNQNLRLFINAGSLKSSGFCPTFTVPMSNGYFIQNSPQQ